MDKPAFDDVVTKRLDVKALPYALHQHPHGIAIGFHHSHLVRVFLNMPDKRVFLRMLVDLDVVIHRLLFRRIVHGKFRDVKMPRKAVDLFFHRFLKPLHDEEGNDRGRKANRDTHDSDLVDRG